MKKNLLSVRLHGKHIGILEQATTGKKNFTYDVSATDAISIGMPIREQAYSELPCEAFFGGLLPESETVKKIIGQRYKISHNNTFALLKAIGYDCAGAISFHNIDDPINNQKTFPLVGKIITDNELYQHIKELPQKPLFMNVDGLRLSLAGVHDKAAICMIDKQIALAQNGCPTTHLLKPSAPHYQGLAENEYFCLRIAKRIGLPVPGIELRQIKDISFLLIERYDRRIIEQKVERIHQEDFCQALGILSTKKYQNEGGPSFKNCFELLKDTAKPAVDRNLLANTLIFNYLIGNMDAHSKNFSLLHDANLGSSLAPLYDIINTLIYPDLSLKMAMKIGRKYDINEVTSKDWEQLCLDIQYSYPMLQKNIQAQADLILKAIEKEKENLAEYQNQSVFSKIIKSININITQRLKALNL